jgi:hypothetical protein
MPPTLRAQRRDDVVRLLRASLRKGTWNDISHQVIYNNRAFVPITLVYNKIFDEQAAVHTQYDQQQWGGGVSELIKALQKAGLAVRYVQFPTSYLERDQEQQREGLPTLADEAGTDPWDPEVTPNAYTSICLGFTSKC